MARGGAAERGRRIRGARRLNGNGWLIGLEIHVQLKTQSKLFCGDAVVFDAPPNSNVCPVCLGLPGALPVLNAHAVELALRVAVALGADIRTSSRFTRKNYFYPDLPKGYQITQYDDPLAAGGVVKMRDGSVVRLRRMHLEEDAGRLLHERLPDKTAVDMNRSGVALLEIVTDPDLRSAEAAHAFLVLLKRTLEYLDVSDCEMEKGNLRVDVNVSTNGGSLTELKNMNSFAAVRRAISAEIARQRQIIDAGDIVRPATLAWNDATGELRVMRVKEDKGAYRYVQEPDLPALVIDRNAIASVAATLPALPLERAHQLKQEYALREDESELLASSRALADFFEEVARLSNDPHAASTWTLREVLSMMHSAHESLPLPAMRLAELITIINNGELTTPAAHRVFRAMCEQGTDARTIIEAEGLATLQDTEQAEAWLRDILQAHPKELLRYHQGDLKILEFFVGQLMRASNGRLDPHWARAAVLRAVSQ